jgi:hypothetical protein
MRTTLSRTKCQHIKNHVLHVTIIKLYQNLLFCNFIHLPICWCLQKRKYARKGLLNLHDIDWWENWVLLLMVLINTTYSVITHTYSNIPLGYDSFFVFIYQNVTVQCCNFPCYVCVGVKWPLILREHRLHLFGSSSLKRILIYWCKRKEVTGGWQNCTVKSLIIYSLL